MSSFLFWFWFLFFMVPHYLYLAFWRSWVFIWNRIFSSCQNDQWSDEKKRKNGEKVREKESEGEIGDEEVGRFGRGRDLLIFSHLFSWENKWCQEWQFVDNVLEANLSTSLQWISERIRHLHRQSLNFGPRLFLLFIKMLTLYFLRRLSSC